jgi:hypothetical protein
VIGAEAHQVSDEVLDFYAWQLCAIGQRHAYLCPAAPDAHTIGQRVTLAIANSEYFEVEPMLGAQWSGRLHWYHALYAKEISSCGCRRAAQIQALLDDARAIFDDIDCALEAMQSPARRSQGQYARCEHQYRRQ